MPTPHSLFLLTLALLRPLPLPLSLPRLIVLLRDPFGAFWGITSPRMPNPMAHTAVKVVRRRMQRHGGNNYNSDFSLETIFSGYVEARGAVSSEICSLRFGCSYSLFSAVWLVLN